MGNEPCARCPHIVAFYEAYCLLRDNHLLAHRLTIYLH